jgi:excisionase family DNA binding protein
MEIITSLSKAELEQLIFESVQRVIDTKPVTPVQAPSDEMDLHEVIQLTGLRRPTIYKKVHEGKIPCYRRGKRLLFSRKEIMRWLESQTVRRVSPTAQMERLLAENARAKLN